ncbi:replication protein A 70 kDa DNA-binding subunit D [Artemisia annua]|uniref:Replication protein A 70 kDa DNA-binding subunit D n=1 Tax=Artemisia annua TaxID=35608 RepID=A0A2U1L2C1_ARTAN|nr:replication protein A 70 kDa DNA-binding subunit D [Artemisia annua]
MLNDEDTDDECDKTKVTIEDIEDDIWVNVNDLDEPSYQHDEITDSEECSVIKVKIIHLWKTPTKIMNGSSKGENINMLLMDEKGHKIHACANHYVLDLIRPMLKKNNCIIMSNFNLYTKLEGVRLTNHLDFVCVHDGFEFIEYRDIINNNTDNNVAFDIIGLISSKPKLKAIDIRKKTTIISEFKLQNLSGDEVNVTLWEDNAHKLDSYVSHKDIQNEPIVLIIQLAKINTWGNEQEVSTLSFCTKVIINENIPAITAFKQRLLDNRMRGRDHRLVDEDDNVDINVNENQSKSITIDDVDWLTVKHEGTCNITVIDISDDEDKMNRRFRPFHSAPRLLDNRMRGRDHRLVDDDDNVDINVNENRSKSITIDDVDLLSGKHEGTCNITVIDISDDEDNVHGLSNCEVRDATIIDLSDIEDEVHGSKQNLSGDYDNSLSNNMKAFDNTINDISDDEIYAAGVSGYLNNPNWNNQKQNTPYVYNISDDDVDLHDTDNEIVCLTHNSRRLSKAKSGSGKNICKFDYSDYESDDEVVCFTRSSCRLSKPKFDIENNICKSDNSVDERDAEYREASIEETKYYVESPESSKDDVSPQFKLGIHHTIGKKCNHEDIVDLLSSKDDGTKEASKRKKEEFEEQDICEDSFDIYNCPDFKYKHSLIVQDDCDESTDNGFNDVSSKDEKISDDSDC